ncbi:MAG: sugar kinase [Bradyrhizobiaceae bacterium]|nr:sugar kinase [Bradyrhizobiaceae bacterium]
MQVVSVGEIIIELVRAPDGRFDLGYAGDTFQTAVHLSRSGVKVALATALGNDRYSEQALAAATAEGIATNLVLRVNDRVPGIALVESDGRAERQNEIWRDASPARQLFELPGWDRVAEQLVSANLVYFSGVTLSLYSNVGLGRMLAALEFGRERGARIAFDSNWRFASWRGDDQRARAVLSEALKRSDLALPSFEDEARLWGDASPQTTIERLQTFGVREIVVKNGARPALVHADGKTEEVPVPEEIAVTNGAAAGDAFNAGYLAARLRKESPAAAALAGHRLAAGALRGNAGAAPAKRTTAKTTH